MYCNAKILKFLVVRSALGTFSVVALSFFWLFLLWKLWSFSWFSLHEPQTCIHIIYSYFADSNWYVYLLCPFDRSFKWSNILPLACNCAAGGTPYFYWSGIDVNHVIVNMQFYLLIYIVVPYIPRFLWYF